MRPHQNHLTGARQKAPKAHCAHLEFLTNNKAQEKFLKEKKKNQNSLDEDNFSNV